jgi:hypothetical protein
MRPTLCVRAEALDQKIDEQPHLDRQMSRGRIDCQSASKIDGPSCLTCECYHDGAIAADDPMSADRSRQWAFSACSTRGSVGGRALNSPSRPQTRAMGQRSWCRPAAPERDPNLAELASLCGLSRSHFMRAFKQDDWCVSAPLVADAARQAGEEVCLFIASSRSVKSPWTAGSPIKAI